MPNLCMSITSFVYARGELLSTAWGPTPTRWLEAVPARSCYALCRVEYDELRRAKLLSLGNRFVRHVNRDFSSGLFAYTGSYDAPLAVAAARCRDSSRAARHAGDVSVPLAR